MVNGIDVYAGNGTIPWQDAANLGVTLGIAKATEGTGYQDAQLRNNFDACRSLNLRFGSYHFIRPQGNTADAEARYYFSYVSSVCGVDSNDLCCLDFESYLGFWPLAPGQPSIDYAYVWLATVGNEIGRPPVLYANLSMLSVYLKWDQRLEQFPLWFAGDRPDLVPWPIFLRQTGYVEINGNNYDADYFGPAYTDNGGEKVSDGFVYEALSASTTVPEVTKGSQWIIVGQFGPSESDNGGTLLVRGESTVAKYPNTPVVGVDGEYLGRISRWNGGTGGQATTGVPTTLTIPGPIVGTLHD